MSLFDENAFGILISYYAVEDEEYALERDEFVARFTEFRTSVLDYVTTLRIAERAEILDFGHAIYVELSDGDQNEDPLAWGKAVRSLLVGRGFESAVVVAHGSRWLNEEEQDLPEAGELAPGLAYAQVSRPSEPLRRALAAEAAARRANEEDEAAWGPGLYVDSEAVEALGRTFKNAPTPLELAGARFYRVGR